jgi:hypothetical protein
VFDNPTIEGVELELMKIQAGSELSRMLANLESLSDDELEAELADQKHLMERHSGRE